MFCLPENMRKETEVIKLEERENTEANDSTETEEILTRPFPPPAASTVGSYHHTTKYPCF